MLTAESSRILVIDDNRAIHDDFNKILTPDREDQELDEAAADLFGEPTGALQMPRFEIDSAYQGQEGLQAVRQAAGEGRPYAMAFVDVRMPPGWDGIETVSRIWQEYGELQIVVCTAYSDYSWEEIVERLGHNDRLLILKKPFDNIEVRQLAMSLTRKWQLARHLSRRLADLEGLVEERTSSLQEANRQLQQEVVEKQAVMEATPDAIVITDAAGIIRMVNQRTEEQFGYQRSELLGQVVEILLPERSRAVHPAQRTAYSRCPMHRPMGMGREFAGRRKDGSEFAVEVCLNPLQTADGLLVVSSIRDISERLALDRRLRESQKLEAVGQLAAGVAHDFNNILQVIMGYASLAQADESCSSSAMEEIVRATERAINLTRQLLMFSRKQTLQMAPLDLGRTVRGVGAMLARLLGDDIALVLDPGDAPLPVMADGGMIEQIIVNLAVNARDAMPRGGRLTIRAYAEIPPTSSGRVGHHACLTVEDCGGGMDPATLQRIFEPFFSTKEVGKGTGLGLSTVHGIVEQHQGWIDVQSSLGRGSTFKVYLPLGAPLPQHCNVAPHPSPDLQKGQGAILLVEDEPAVRGLARSTLERAGYTVIEADCGRKALQCWERRGGQIDLLLTDLVMPGGMNGLELARELLSRRSDLTVLYSSGYSQEVVQGADVLQDGVNFLPKPYHPTVLADMVQRMLTRR